MNQVKRVILSAYLRAKVQPRPIGKVIAKKHTNLKNTYKYLKRKQVMNGTGSIADTFWRPVIGKPNTQKQ